MSDLRERRAIVRAAWARLQDPAAVRPGECWMWPGAKSRSGYGVVQRHGQKLAHRAAWIEAHGPIPVGLVVCHRCDTPGCYRPAHLFIGTHADNVADRIAKGRTFIPGSPDGRVKLTDSQVAEIRTERAAGAVIADIAHRYGVTPSLIGLIVRGERRAAPTGVVPKDPAAGRAEPRVLPGRARPSHCPQGHPYVGTNVGIRPNGHRWCRACARERSRRARGAEPRPTTHCLREAAR